MKTDETVESKKMFIINESLFADIALEKEVVDSIKKINIKYRNEVLGILAQNIEKVVAYSSNYNFETRNGKTISDSTKFIGEDKNPIFAIADGFAYSDLEIREVELFLCDRNTAKEITSKKISEQFEEMETKI